MKVAPGTDIIRASNEAEDIDEGKKQATYVMSPPTADRHGTLFIPSGWEARLGHFRANPVFIMSHNSWGGPEALLGSWVEVWIDKKRGLMGRAEYDLDHCSLAREVWPMVEAGLIKAVSVGARVYGAVYWDEEAGIKELPPYARKMFKDEEIWAAFTDQELLECSQVLIGSNRQALKQAVERGLCTRSFALGMSWEQDATTRIIRPSGAPIQECDEKARLAEGAAAGTLPACMAVLNKCNDEVPAAEAPPQPETREGGPAMDPKHYFRTINEIRKERGEEPIEGGDALVLPAEVRTVSTAPANPAAAETRAEEPAVIIETPSGLTLEDVRGAVKAEFDAFLEAGGGIAVPATETGRTLSDDQIEEVTDAMVDFCIEHNRTLSADERAAFIKAYFKI